MGGLVWSVIIVIYQEFREAQFITLADAQQTGYPWSPNATPRETLLPNGFSLEFRWDLRPANSYLEFPHDRYEREVSFRAGDDLGVPGESSMIRDQIL